MVSDISREPATCLLFEILVQPTAVVTDSLSKCSLDVDQRQMVEHIPNDDPAELPDGDAPAPKLVLRPQSRAVHVEQRTVEIEKRRGS